MALGALRNLFQVLKSYCSHSSIAGVSYITNSRYHSTERIFWFCCLALALYGSYHLIHDELNALQNGAVNIIIENLQPWDKSTFPSVGICEMGNTKETYEKLEDIVNELNPDEDEYPFDIEDFLFRVIFHNLYNFGSIVSYCEPHRDCSDCAQCPASNYSVFTEKVRAPCPKLLKQCVWNHKPFDCCHYFQPLQTSLGRCFLINSIQIVEKNGPFWKDMFLCSDCGEGELKIEFYKAASIFIINEEEIPHMLLTRLQYNMQHEGLELFIYLNLQNVVNEESVRSVNPDARMCYFPDEEVGKSVYKYYSYSTCVTECLKDAQIRACNCTHHNMIYDKNDKSVACNYDGLLCLDTADLIFPQTTIMQPWRTNGLVCDCLPSCTDNVIRTISRYQAPISGSNRRVRIGVQNIPTQKYLRQSARENLDLVVSIGGILGLFLGASILSGIEFLHFFTARWIGNIWLEKQKLRKNKKLGKQMFT